MPLVDETTAQLMRVPVAAPVDERAARQALRDQIRRLEAELGMIVNSTYPRIRPGRPVPSLAGPRVLSLGDLERVRDALAARLAAAQRSVAAQRIRQLEARELLDEMLADPPRHKWIRVSNAALGEPGCKHYHVRPHLGPIGLLMGWWRVKISSGCPLGWGS